MKFQKCYTRFALIASLAFPLAGHAEVAGLCGEPLPKEMSNQVQNLKLSCGAPDPIGYSRTYEPISPALEAKWIELQNSGSPDNREERQKLRQTDAKMTGKVIIPVTESWTYIQTTYDRYSHCPQESYTDTCSDPIYGSESYEESYCAEYEQTTSSSDYGSGSSSSSSDYGSSSSSSSSDYGSSSSSSSSDYGSSSSSSSSDYGSSSSSSSSDSYSSSSSAGESSSSISNSYDSRGGSDDSFQSCARYSTRTATRQVVTGERTYSCTKTRNSICAKDVRTNASRVCVKREVPYTVQYKHDPNWKPGFTTPNRPERDYYDILPNKFDLLPGESETGIVGVNSKEGAVLTPSLKLQSVWNEYKTSVDSQSQLSCSLNNPMSVVLNIDTVGRNKRKAPNFLSLPVDESGNKIEPLTFESVMSGKGRPIKVKLQDHLRASYLAAAKDSRLINGDPSTKTTSPQNILFKMFGSTNPPTSQVAFWAQTEFRLQLFRKDRWQRWVRVTLPMKFNSDKGDILGDSVVISLEAQDGLDRFYRPAAPLDAILGGIYKKFGVELSPGVTYYLKIQSAVKGLPFYMMGCRGGNDVCEDKEPRDSYYSEPVVVEFKTDADSRSWFKRFLDFQEKFMIF